MLASAFDALDAASQWMLDVHGQLRDGLDRGPTDSTWYSGRGRTQRPPLFSCRGVRDDSVVFPVETKATLD